MKKMSISLIVLFALCVFLPASARVNLGVLGGLNLASVNIDPSAEERGIEKSNLTAFGFGGLLDYCINESLTLHLELMYLQKGYNAVGEMHNVTFDFQEKYTYIEFPVMLKYAFITSEIRPYVITGPTIGYLLSAEWLGDHSIKDYRKDFNFGLGFGAGVSVPISNNSIFLEARYAFGLTNTLDLPNEPDEPDEECKTKGIQIFAGITFPIGK